MNMQLTTKGVVASFLIQHYIRLSGRIGFPFEQLLREANVQFAELNPSHGWITQDILERLSQSTFLYYPDPLLGLRFLKMAEPAMLGVLGYMVQSSPTLLDMFHTLNEFGHLVSTVSRPILTHEPGVVLWTVRHQSDDLFFVRQCDETYIMACAILVKRQCPQALKAIRFSHDPTLENQQIHPIYQQLCRCPIYFNQPHSALVLDAQYLNSALPFADVLVYDSLRQHARNLLNQLGAEPSLIHQVKEKLRVLLAKGISSRDAVAESLGMSSRHLHRQLQTQGCHYQGILDELRSELAHKYLLQAHYDLDDIAVLLGFGSARSFCRWFSQEMGITPSEFRQKSLS